jgi:methionine-rich copper-binding protein CopC
MNMLKIGNTRKAALAAVMTLFASTIASSAMAETQWEKNHPRRDQVNDRLANQDKRIHQEVKEGEMSKAKAARLHKEDRQVRKEERVMASQNGGHITKQEQKNLKSPGKRDQQADRQVMPANEFGDPEI